MIIITLLHYKIYKLIMNITLLFLNCLPYHSIRAKKESSPHCFPEKLQPSKLSSFSHRKRSILSQRSFSKLKLIKTYLRSTMGQERLCGT